MLTVLKPIPHRSRRLVPGDTITEADLVGCPVPLAELKKRKFVAGAETKTAEVAVEKAAAVADTPAGEPRD